MNERTFPIRVQIDKAIDAIRRATDSLDSIEVGGGDVVYLNTQLDNAGQAIDKAQQIAAALNNDKVNYAADDRDPTEVGDTVSG